MQVGSLLPIVIVILLIGSALLVLGSMHSVHIDIASTATGFYIVFMVLIMEGAISFIPTRVREVLTKASILVFLPAFLLLFYAGYRFGTSIKIMSVFISFLVSVSIGVGGAILAFIILSTVNKYRGNKA